MASPSRFFSSGPRCARLLARVGLASLLASGCFIEPDEPPGWRASCTQDDDCASGERCTDTLCQVLCTTATFAQDCPSDGNYTACFNGVCASTCDAANDSCPSPHSCQSVEIPPEFAEFGLSDFAVCGIACDESRPCPEGELCLEGACADPGAIGSSGSGSETGGETGGL